MFEVGGIGIRTEMLSNTSTHTHTSLDCRTETLPMLEVRDGRRLEDVVQQLHGRMQYPRKLPVADCQ